MSQEPNHEHDIWVDRLTRYHTAVEESLDLPRRKLLLEAFTKAYAEARKKWEEEGIKFPLDE